MSPWALLLCVAFYAVTVFGSIYLGQRDMARRVRQAMQQAAVKVTPTLVDPAQASAILAFRDAVDDELAGGA